MQDSFSLEQGIVSWQPATFSFGAIQYILGTTENILGTVKYGCYGVFPGCQSLFLDARKNFLPQSFFLGAREGFPGPMEVFLARNVLITYKQ